MKTFLILCVLAAVALCVVKVPIYKNKLSEAEQVKRLHYY